MSATKAEVASDILREVQKLDSYMRSKDYSGPDPYDGLNSPIARYAFTKGMRQVVVQVNRRSPLELRGFLQIAPVQMSKTLGLALTSLSLGEAWLPEAAPRGEELRRLLLRKRNADGGWGYEFDVQMRWGRYFAGSSNIIATSFAVDGLLSQERGLENETWKGEVAGWIESVLCHEGYISYAPGSVRLIHNANLLGAVTLVDCGGSKVLAESALLRTLDAQRPDGSFPYGDQAKTSWVDAFHTAYVLLALKRLSASFPYAKKGLEKGLEFWLNHCFTAKHEVKYFSEDNEPTEDAHTLATTLLTLSVFGHYPEVAATLQPFAEAFRSKLNSSGFITNRGSKTPYMRWELAHQLRAMAEFAHRYADRPGAR